MDAAMQEAVGPGQPNRERDVRLVQRLLDQRMGVTGMRVPVTGKFDLWLERVIVRFQRQQLRQFFADGIIRPNDNAFWSLMEAAPVRMLAGALGGILMVPVQGPLDFEKSDFQRIGQELAVEARTAKAVNIVESRFGPYDRLGRPSILYERHLFASMTFHRWDVAYPFISAITPGGYNFPERDQYRRLQQAFALNRDAALQSASWGGFQILGKNHKQCGYGTVTEFVQAMCRSKEEQCDAFIEFVKADHVLWHALQQKDWPTVARVYNGKYFYKETPPYNRRLELAYAAASDY